MMNNNNNSNSNSNNNDDKGVADLPQFLLGGLVGPRSAGGSPTRPPQLNVANNNNNK